MHNYKDLKVWQKGIDLVSDVYQLTSNFPESEKFGLISQIRRCAISIPSNIAEGSGRRTNMDFIRFLDISNGSSFELESHLIISKNLNLITESDISDVLNRLIEIQKMIFRLVETLK